MGLVFGNHGFSEKILRGRPIMLAIIAVPFWFEPSPTATSDDKLALSDLFLDLWRHMKQTVFATSNISGATHRAGGCFVGHSNR